jgi:DNA-binding response OmpR family regulator
MEQTPQRILVVEDERNIAAGLKLNFELEGYAVEVAGSARDAAALLAGSDHFALILLDVMLPDADGFQVCRRIRAAGDFTPVLMLTARDTTEDRVRGLEAGADDYITKPFELEELIARVRSMLRRRGWEQSSSAQSAHFTLRFGGAEVDFERGEVSVRGAPVSLTRLELDLLRYFAENPRKVCSRAELQAEVWKLDNYPNSRMVDNFILRLRKHFEEEPSSPRHFLVARGAGYKFVPDP